MYWILQWKCIAKSAEYPQSTIIKCYASYDEFKAILRREYLIIFKISARIWMLIDTINVAEWFHAKSPSLTRCKEGDLPLLNFSNLTCMGTMWKVLSQGIHMCNMKALSLLIGKLWPRLKFLFTHTRRRRHQGYDISSPDIRPGSLKIDPKIALSQIRAKCIIPDINPWKLQPRS